MQKKMLLQNIFQCSVVTYKKYLMLALLFLIIIEFYDIFYMSAIPLHYSTQNPFLQKGKKWTPST